jgi:nicotinamidase/pyrazinamidase
VQGTPGAEFHPELRLPAATEIVSKGMDPRSDAYSCFQAEAADGSPFAAALGEHGVSRLFVGGLATDYCVKATVVDGTQAGFEVIVLEDAVAAVDLAPGDGARALDEMRAAGALLIRLDDLA